MSSARCAALASSMYATHANMVSLASFGVPSTRDSSSRSCAQSPSSMMALDSDSSCAAAGEVEEEEGGV
jgi:hypothetical protein